MKYQILARKYRPQRFEEVVGQEAVVQTLKNAIKQGRLAHAYLFSGSRGIGKTTLARLFAKALNCTSRVEGEPCNQCPSCLDILSGQSLDVIEIDGASNRGIDDIRQINETVGFAPSYGQYKIYIIDEVHMLTKEAFNALLKTLEEPPESAKFFFATTEAHKVLPTILSRCQRFDLSRPPISQIISKLKMIANDLKKVVEEDAIYLIAAHADGSFRDAESLFDQILCFADTKAVTAIEVRASLGLVAQDLFFSLDRAFDQQHFAASFELVEKLFATGKDLAHFLEQLIEHYRHIVVVKTRGEVALGFSTTLAADYAKAAALYSEPQSLAILDLLLKASVQMGKSASTRVTLELTLLQVLRMKNRIPIEALVRRLSEIEEKIKNDVSIEAALPPTTPPVKPPSHNDVSIEPPPSEALLPPIKHPSHNELVEPPVELKSVPFSPHTVKVEAAAPPAAPPSKHPSHYATLMRFAAVELEGTIKN